jgi:ABC-type multidrug transport system permease subunit
MSERPPAQVTAGSATTQPSALVELTRMRVLMFIRDPGALFWVFGFPLVLAFVLGLAFRNRPPDPIHVVVADSPSAAAALKGDPSLAVEEAPLEEARWKLRRAQVDLLVQVEDGQVTYRYDETRGEGRVARLAVERALERSHGRTDTTVARDEKVTEPGSRYIDFLVPGLIGMNLMGSSMWGIAYGLVDARKRKLLKRLAATPMQRRDFLLSILLSRLMFLAFETTALVAISWLAFGVAVQGSVAAVGFLSVLGGLGFAGIAMLIGARTQSTETAGGLMNLVMMPMYLLSGAFFSAKHFPDVLQPFIKALPLTALNDSLRAVINEAAPLSTQMAPMLVLAAWGVLPFIVAMRTFRWQ